MLHSNFLKYKYTYVKKPKDQVFIKESYYSNLQCTYLWRCSKPIELAHGNDVYDFSHSILFNGIQTRFIF